MSETWSLTVSKRPCGLLCYRSTVTLPDACALRQTIEQRIDSVVSDMEVIAGALRQCIRQETASAELYEKMDLLRKNLAILIDRRNDCIVRTACRKDR